ncbi:MAG: tyrosine-type recombinase/integrase [Geminicoccaceae bacterium]
MATVGETSRAEAKIMPEPFERKGRRGWWYWYKDATGKFRLKKGGVTKAEAWAAVIATERELQPVRLGLIDAKTHEAQKYTKRPIREIIVQFEKSMRGKRRSENHIKTTIGDVCAVFGVDDPDAARAKRRRSAGGYKPKPCNWSCLADIDAAQFERFLNDVSQTRSAGRRNRYLTNIAHLVNWAVGCGWMPYNPLRGLGKLNEDKDRRRVRRSLTEDEVWRLIDTTRNQGWGGPNRSLYYWVALRLGLRWTEIARLRRRHIDLGDDPCLILDAKATKNGQGAVLPIPGDLADALRDHLGLGQKLFEGKPDRKTWKRDLERAGIEYETIDGCAYRGATRTTFGTHLYRAGVDLRTAQELMRHSDPKLTAKLYQRVRLLDTRPAVDKLSRPEPKPDSRSEAG